MNNKVKIPKEIAAEIEKARENVPRVNADHYLLSLAFRYTHGNPGMTLFKFAQENYEDYVQAVVNGYTVDQTPEDKVREFYKDRRKSSEGSLYWEQANTVQITLDLLGIKIEGVNA
jgi:hypothetical protein